MSHPSATGTQEKPRSGSSIRDGAIRAAAAGAGAGLFAALLDARQAWPGVVGAGERVLLVLNAVSLLVAAGMVLGALAWAVASAGARLWIALGRSPARGSAWLPTLLAAPFLAWIAVLLFRGGFTSGLPFRWLLMPATAMALIAAFRVATGVALGLVSRADGRGRRAPRLVLITAAIVVATLGLRWADAHLYRRLYQYLHLALAAGTMGGFALALRISLFSGRPAPGRAMGRLGIAIVALAVALPAATLATIDRRQTVKVALHERTATTGNLLRLAGRPAARRAAAPSAEIRRLHYEREREARAAAAGADWAVFPGAHLVLITIDALRADRLGSLGHDSRDLTPHLDRLAAAATLFERAYCPAPHSSFSIASLHTSRDLHEEAAMDLNLEHPTLADVLGQAGYRTRAFYTNGIFHTEGDRMGYYRRERFGFSRARHGAPGPEELTDLAIAEMDGLVSRGEPPMFVWLHYFNVHEPYESTRFGQSPEDRYDGEIFEADAAVGRLIEWIDATLARDTVIVVSADHGEEFGEHGGYYHGSTLYDEQVRVPLIVRVPGATPARIASPVSTLDLAPTLLGILGLAPVAGMIGQDLRSAIFAGEEAHVPRPVFAAVMRRHMVLRWPWKLIADRSRGLYELYDLESDPAERVNRHDEQAALARELLEEINLRADLLGRGNDPSATVLNLARAKDPRSLPGLLDLIADDAAPLDSRLEALALIGALGLPEAADRMAFLLDFGDERLAMAAALSMGDLGDDRGADLLEDALFSDDPGVRDRAAMALARMGDDAAVPALIEALGRADLGVRKEAIRHLGRLGDPLAVEPLIETIAEARTRYLTVLALGQIRDPRAYTTLRDVLAHETQTDVRGYAVLALGWLGLPEAIPLLLRALAREPELRWTAESLVRLGAAGEAPLFGTDMDRRAADAGGGWAGCHEKPLVMHDEFLDRTTCRSQGRVATLRFAADLTGHGELIVRGRHLDADPARTIPLAVEVGGRTVAVVELEGRHREIRLAIPEGTWPRGEREVTLRLAEKGAFELDHLLVLDVGAVQEASF